MKAPSLILTISRAGVQIPLTLEAGDPLDEGFELGAAIDEAGEDWSESLTDAEFECALEMIDAYMAWEHAVEGVAHRAMDLNW